MRVQSFIIVMALPFASSSLCFAQISSRQPAPSPALSSVPSPAPSIVKSSGRPQTGQSVVKATTPATGTTSPVSQQPQYKLPELVRRPITIRTIAPVSYQQEGGSSDAAAVTPAVVDGNRPSVKPGEVSQVVDLQPPATRVPALPASASRGVQLQALVPMSEQTASTALPTAVADGGALLLQPILPRTGNAVAPATEAANIPFEVLQMTRLTGTSTDKPLASASPTKTLSTESMIGPLGDPSFLFGKLNTTPVPAAESLAPVRTQMGQVQWAPDVYTWVTPTFYHKPLYFEQPNLERYGMGTYRWLQPAASSAHFFSSIALMPYKALTQHPLEHVYTLGYDRPGNCAAFQGRPLLGQSTVGEACKVYDPYSGY